MGCRINKLTNKINSHRFTEPNSCKIAFSTIPIIFLFPGSTHRGCILNVTLTGGFWRAWQPPQNYETTTVSQARNGMPLSKSLNQLYTHVFTADFRNAWP